MSAEPTRVSLEREASYFVDRRGEPRVRLERHAVLLNADATFASDGRAAPTTDLSRGGVGFLADRPMDPGAELRFAIQVPFRQTHLRVRGRIVHCAAAGGGRFRVGAAYARLAATSDEALFDTLLGLLL